MSEEANQAVPGHSHHPRDALQPGGLRRNARLCGRQGRGRLGSRRRRRDDAPVAGRRRGRGRPFHRVGSAPLQVHLDHIPQGLQARQDLRRGRGRRRLCERAYPRASLVGLTNAWAPAWLPRGLCRPAPWEHGWAGVWLLLLGLRKRAGVSGEEERTWPAEASSYPTRKRVGPPSAAAGPLSAAAPPRHASRVSRPARQLDHLVITRERLLLLSVPLPGGGRCGSCGLGPDGRGDRPGNYVVPGVTALPLLPLKGWSVAVW